LARKVDRVKNETLSFSNLIAFIYHLQNGQINSETSNIEARLNDNRNLY